MRLIAGLVLIIATFGTTHLALAQVPADRIEEDWQLVVATPDVTGVGPQITTSMSPVTDPSTAPFVALDMNYREYPSFVAGGLQTQVWSNGAQPQQYATSGKTAQFATVNETITWTQRMSLASGQITYQVVSGQSTTWGAFGTDLTIGFPTALTSLSGYSPNTSTANSGASWEVNNVQQLTLVAVRYYSGSTLLATDTTSRPVVTNGQPVASASRPPFPGPRSLLAMSTPPPSSMPAALGSRRPRRGGSPPASPRVV